MVAKLFEAPLAFFEVSAIEFTVMFVCHGVDAVPPASSTSRLTVCWNFTLNEPSDDFIVIALVSELFGASTARSLPSYIFAATLPENIAVGRHTLMQ